MFDKDFVERFNELERILYKYILNNQKKIITMKIRELAMETHVSTTTIIRFCKKLNCDGFSEFKVKWKLYLDDKNKSIATIDDSSMFLDFFEKVNYTDFPIMLESVCEELKRASNIIFVGIGSSGITAKYGARYFSTLGKVSLAIDDPFYPINNIGEGTTAVILSVSGESKGAIDLSVNLSNAKCRIISITNSSNCTIAKLSDINIPYYIVSEKKGTKDLTSQVPSIYILETLAKRLYEK